MRVKAKVTLIICKPHFLQLLSPPLSYVGKGTSCKDIRKREYALEEMIPTCSNSNIQNNIRAIVVTLLMAKLFVCII